MFDDTRKTDPSGASVKLFERYFACTIGSLLYRSPQPEKRAIIAFRSTLISLIFRKIPWTFQLCESQRGFRINTKMRTKHRSGHLGEPCTPDGCPSTVQSSPSTRPTFYNPAKFTSNKYALVPCSLLFTRYVFNMSRSKHLGLGHTKHSVQFLQPGPASGSALYCTLCALMPAWRWIGLRDIARRS